MVGVGPAIPISQYTITKKNFRSRTQCARGAPNKKNDQVVLVHTSVITRTEMTKGNVCWSSPKQQPNKQTISTTRQQQETQWRFQRKPIIKASLSFKVTSAQQTHTQTQWKRSDSLVIETKKKKRNRCRLVNNRVADRKALSHGHPEASPGVSQQSPACPL